MEDDAGFDIISRIRCSELGTNPFITIMVTIRSSDGDIVQKVIENGVDEL